MIILIFIIIGVLFTLMLLYHIFEEITDCRKLNNKFAIHDWEYRDDLYIPDPESSHGKFLIGLFGHNISSKNRRWVCLKCDKIQYL